jgi:hypothetical protein
MITTNRHVTKSKSLEDSEQGKPWPGPPTWAAIISMDRSLGLADDYVAAN